jgi:hypothetical protein
VSSCPKWKNQICDPTGASVNPCTLLSFLKFILGGDWNAKHTNWGSRITAPKGRNFLQSITNYNCSYLSTGEPTYWPSDPNKTQDPLDFFVFKSTATNYIQIAANWDLSSDHTPIITTLSTHILCKPKAPRLITSKTDWNAFRIHTVERIKLNIKLKQPDNIDEAVHSHTCLIKEAAWKSTPLTPPGNEPTNSTPLYIRKLVTEKRRARNRWQRSRNPLDKREYNQLTRHLRAAIQESRNATFGTYTSTVYQKTINPSGKPLNSLKDQLFTSHQSCRKTGTGVQQIRKKWQPSLHTSPTYSPHRIQTPTAILRILSKHT